MLLVVVVAGLVLWRRRLLRRLFSSGDIDATCLELLLDHGRKGQTAARSHLLLVLLFDATRLLLRNNSSCRGVFIILLVTRDGGSGGLRRDSLRSSSSASAGSLWGDKLSVQGAFLGGHPADTTSFFPTALRLRNVEFRINKGFKKANR